MPDINPYDDIPQPSAGVLYERCTRGGAGLASVTAVVIDALRATPSIVAALAAGAREVAPFATADDAPAEADHPSSRRGRGLFDGWPVAKRLPYVVPARLLPCHGLHAC